MDNAKGRLQEIFQGKGLPLPRYEVKSLGGPPNSPVFLCTVTVWCSDGRQLSEQVEVKGRKREAEKLAACKMLQTLQRGKSSGKTPRTSPSRGHSSPSPASNHFPNQPAPASTLLIARLLPRTATERAQSQFCRSGCKRCTSLLRRTLRPAKAPRSDIVARCKVAGGFLISPQREKVAIRESQRTRRRRRC